VTQAEFVEHGTRASQLSRHLTSSVVISIDGEALDRRAIASPYYLTDSALRSNDGELTGTFGGNISFCFSIKDYSMGKHEGVLRLTTLSGIEKTYKWEFEISNS